MNILILINSAPNYKYFFHELGKEIESRGHQVFYAVDSHRSKFLEPLKAVDEGSNTIFFDSFLEKNFKENLDIAQINEHKDSFWGDYFYSDFDRFLVHDFNLDKNKNYWLNVKVNLDLFFEQVMKEKKIDIVLYEHISNSFAYAAYQQCKALGKKYVGLMGSRLPNHFEIQNSIIDDEVKKLEKLSQAPITQDEKEWFEGYKKSIVDIQPDYMKQNGLDNVSLGRIVKVAKFLKAIRFFTMGFKYNYFYDYQFGNPFKVPFKALRVNYKRFVNTKKSQKYYINNDELELASQKEDFYVYPIHYHPESSTSVLAPEYTNEYSNIINIANNLPFGTYLYVKDHKSAKGVQDHSFYKKVSALPNVRLVNFDVNIKKLILKSKGVITVNSTAGYEALLLNKPVYLFGRVFYENFNNVYKVKFQDLRSIHLINQDFKPIELNFISYKRYCYNGCIKISAIKDSCYFENISEIILRNVDGMTDEAN